MQRPPSEDVPLFSTRSLEGEYTAWNYVWSRDYGAGVALDGIIVDNYGTVYACDSVNSNLYVRTFLGVETNVANRDLYMWDFFGAKSATGKYVLVFRPVGTWTVFDVWRYGAVIFTRDLQADDANARYLLPFAISPNGKFIAVITDRLAVPVSMVMLYEGV